eukprot:TRINITY_DN66943_c10_g1_i12.p1 TRINITY_DN66943_c10_g1~~TRINITY_DN66943_c10_g1_i12.p1  ORF type:complete len:232 (-),score=18.44 TRINITY_DN66943_c10_g1_i12:154-849(-)
MILMGGISLIVLHKFSVILDYLRHGKVSDWEKFSADKASDIQTEFDFYQLPFPHQHSSLQPPLLCWDQTTIGRQSSTAMDANTAGFNLINNAQTLSVTSTATEPRYICSSDFPSGCGIINFSLKTTRTHPFGSLLFKGGVTGLALSSGDWTTDNGKTWEDSFPSLKSEFDKGLVVHEFKFIFHLSGKSSSVTVTWPTGVTKVLQLPTQPKGMALGVHKDCAAGLFELKQQH